jgi:hypothetical protein
MKVFWTDNRRTWFYFVLIVALLAIAFLAPITANALFGALKPIAESNGVWFQRSGAISTVFALLAATLQADASRKLWTPGFLGDIHKLAVLSSFEGKFSICQNLSLLFTLLGTVIWGYGDILFAKSVSAICAG